MLGAVMPLGWLILLLPLLSMVKDVMTWRSRKYVVTNWRVVQIAGTEVPLGDANVVMVDRVDVPDGLTIFGTGTVERRVDALPNGLYDALRGAPDLVTFLRCDASLPVPPAPKDVPAEAAAAVAAYLQQAMDAGCARMQGK